MDLPKIRKYLKSNKTLSIFLTPFIISLLVIVFWFLLINKTKNNPPTVNDPTKRTTVIYQGKEISVPPKVLQISAEDLYHLLQTKSPVMVVEVTSISDWQQGHIKGSFVMPKSFFSDGPDGLSPNTNLALVSSDGVDSALVAEKLIGLYAFDRQKTMSLQGGLNAWKTKGYPLEK